MHHQYRDLGEIDLELHLQEGAGLFVDNIEVRPYLMREIRQYTYAHFMRNLQWISLSVDDFIKSVEDIEKRITLQQEKSNLKPFDFYARLGGIELRESMLNALAMILKTDDVRMLDENIVAVDFLKNGIYVENENGELVPNEERLESLTEDDMKLITRDNFDQIVEIALIQNYLKKPVDKKKELNPADEATRSLMEQMDKMRKKVEEKKAKKRQAESGDDDQITVATIISSVTAKSNSINKFNVWDLTLYALYDEYARLELIDNYDFSIRAMMAGAKDIDLKHWSSKI